MRHKDVIEGVIKMPAVELVSAATSISERIFDVFPFYNIFLFTKILHYYERSATQLQLYDIPICRIYNT